MNTKRILIVGGCGFVGQNLAVSLVEKGFSVLILDNANYPAYLHKYKNIYFSKIDLLDVGDVEQRIAGFSPILVVHLASWGMSGEGMLNPLCHKINVNGTQTLLDACLKFNIPKFVYTSSYNVVFGGEEISGGDESMDYFPENRQVDEYSASKTRAEKIVLQANGKLCKNGKTRLLTSSLRPCAIYGEGEQRHLPRILKHMDNGLFLVKIGSATVDWIHIENLVAVFLLLIDKLLVLEDPAAVPAGQAYFISDGTPIDNFDFLRPLCEARLRTYPSAVVPTWFMLAVSYTLERVYFATKKLGVPLVPILTRAEVLKVGVTHHFSIDKARRELGYEPKISSQQGGERLAVYYTSEGRFTNADYFEIAHIGWYAIIFAGMSLLAICAFGSHSTLQGNVFISHVNWLALAIFRTQPILTYVFYAAVGTHLFEALTAVSLSRSIGCKNTAIAWGVQTLLLGYPSLKMLYARRKAFARRKRRNDDTSISGSNSSVNENKSAITEVKNTLLLGGKATLHSAVSEGAEKDLHLEEKDNSLCDTYDLTVINFAPQQLPSSPAARSSSGGEREHRTVCVFQRNTTEDNLLRPVAWLVESDGVTTHHPASHDGKNIVPAHTTTRFKWQDTSAVFHEELSYFYKIDSFEFKPTVGAMVNVDRASGANLSLQAGKHGGEVILSPKGEGNAGKYSVKVGNLPSNRRVVLGVSTAGLPSGVMEVFPNMRYRLDADVEYYVAYDVFTKGVVIDSMGSSLNATRLNFPKPVKGLTSLTVTLNAHTAK